MTTLSTELTRDNYTYLFQVHTSMTMRRNGIPNAARSKKVIDKKLDEFYDSISAWEYRAFKIRDEIDTLLKNSGV